MREVTELSSPAKRFYRRKERNWEKGGSGE